MELKESVFFNVQLITLQTIVLENAYLAVPVVPTILLIGNPKHVSAFAHKLIPPNFMLIIPPERVFQIAQKLSMEVGLLIGIQSLEFACPLVVVCNILISQLVIV